MKEHGRVRLAVLGGVKAFVDGEPARMRSRKAHALLAYLTLSGKVCVQREYLAGLFWGDVETAKARSSLRQTVTELRNAFDSRTKLLIIGRSEITLRRSEITTDIDEMCEELEQGRVPEALMAGSALAESILHGFDDLGETFGGWLQEIRTVTERRLQTLLQNGYRDTKAAYATRKQMAEAALLLDPMQEDACRELMRLSAEAGDLGTALRAYERLYTALDEEMGMEPSAQTQDLIVRIKQGDFDSCPQPEAPRDNILRPAEAMFRSGTPRLAIMPLRILGPETMPDHLAEMLLDDIVCKLAGLKEPSVISSNSTRGFAPDGSDAAAVRDQLFAQYAVYGKIGRAGEQYRLSVELVDLRTAETIWAKNFQIAENDLFLTQSLIAGQVANQLVPSLNSSELRLTASYQPEDLAAYHLTLRARELLFELERQPFQEAETLLALALEKDPGFAPAYVTYANWYSLKLGQRWSEDPLADRLALEDMARSATRLSGMTGAAMAMLAHNQAIHGLKFKEALALFDHAVESAPNDSETLMWSAPTLSFAHQHDLALERASQAIALSPQDPLLFRFEHFLAIAHFFAGDYERAADYGKSSMERNPHYMSNARITAAALAEIGEMEEARNYARIVIEEQPDFRVGKFAKTMQHIHPEDRQHIGQLLLSAGIPA